MAAIGIAEVAPGAGVLWVLCNIFFTFSKILCFHDIGIGISIDIPESLGIGIGWHQIGSISIGWHRYTGIGIG